MSNIERTFYCFLFAEPRLNPKGLSTISFLYFSGPGSKATFKAISFLSTLICEIDIFIELNPFFFLSSFRFSGQPLKGALIQNCSQDQSIHPRKKDAATNLHNNNFL